MNSTALILIVFLVCCIVSVLYWNVVWEVAVRGLRFRLFARRDTLRRLALDKEVDCSSFEYRHLEEFICKTVAVVPSISLASLILSMIKRRNPKSDDMERFRKEASPQLIELLDITGKDALCIMALNSPILISLLGVVGLVLGIIVGINKTLVLIYRQTEHVVDELPAESVDAMPQAA